MPDQLRTCRRTGCRWPAAASLSFRYATAQVWLLDLTDEPDPSLWDLCPHHADQLTVPRGWERVDQRTTPSPPVEPSGRDLDRYARLRRDLPRLAAEFAEHRDGVVVPIEFAGSKRGRDGLNP